MMWPSVKLADCVDLLSGFAFKSEKFTQNADDIPLVKGENVSQGRILWDISKRWPVAQEPSAGRYRLLPDDVVVAMDRPWVPAGLKWAYIRRGDPDALLVQRCCRLRSRRHDLDQRYLRFIIGGPGFESYLKPITTGVNVPHVSGAQILDFQFALPPLGQQRRIAAILSAYDDLIENTRRRIQILEEMARSLYREWFVEFRYPGHEGVPMVETAAGRVPRGWEATTLGGVTSKIGSGATPRGGKESYRTDGTRLIRSLNIYDYEFSFEDLAFIDDSQAAALHNVSVEPHDVLLNITGASVARCAMVPSYLLPARVNQHVAIIRANPIRTDPYFLLDTINNTANKKQILGLAQGGATREALTKETLCALVITNPPVGILKRYSVVAGGIHLQRELLQRQATNLRTTRDLLLPRLLSGQLDVSTLADVP